jgi:glycosyltransferase involved in cell wall biosynthesis
MIIGIDASRLLLKNRTGIEEYSYQIIKAFSWELKNEKVVLYLRPAAFEGLLDDVNGNIDLNLYFKKNTRKILEEHLDFDLPKKWQVKIIPFHFFWTQIGLALEMLLSPVDALFVPAHTVPWIHPKNTVVVIHGLEYELCPESYSLFSRVFHRFFVKRSCKWARKIVAISEKTKGDLEKLYKVSSDKIAVIYNGTNLQDQARKGKAVSKRIKKLSNKFLFFLSRVEERKNVLGIIECFSILRKKYNYKGKLVLGGKPGVGYEKIKHLIKKKKLESQVVELGFMSNDEKWELIKRADVFMFPSLFEGFGLPILEAQSVDTPVITSDMAPMSEVAGDKNILVDPKDYEEMAKRVDKILKNKKFREAIIKKGGRNIKRFSWQKTAKEIRKLLMA